MRLRKIGRYISIVALVSAGFWALAYFGVSWTREGERTAAIWLANAFALGVLLRTDERLHASLLAACFATNMAVYLNAGDSSTRPSGSRSPTWQKFYS